MFSILNRPIQRYFQSAQSVTHWRCFFRSSRKTSLVAGIAVMLAAVPIPGWAANCLTASVGDTWANQAFSSIETSQFNAAFDATPSAEPSRSLVGFSDGSQTAGTGFGILVRFNAKGDIDARNGSTYAAASTISYTAGLTYHFTLQVNVIAHTYSVSVTPPKGTTTAIGTNYAFRTDQNDVFDLSSIGVHVSAKGSGSLNVCNLSVSATAPQVPNPDCTLMLPAAPLTAAGLATPFLLVATNSAHGPCHETNSAAQSAFAGAAILDPATGQVSVYNPLVIDMGTNPAVPPVVPVLPKNAVVALWFGFNGTNLLLQSTNNTTLTNSNCVNGLGNNLFTQFSYCNAVNFFKAANLAVSNKQLIVPPLGTGKDGRPCPSVRDFSVVDQDQSDNLPTSYLITTSGLLAQNTASNVKALPGATVLGNPSDNRLVDMLLDPALGCTAWTVPDLADPGAKMPALPLNEIQSAAFTLPPVALIPANDPMVLDDGAYSIPKVNLYRQGVNQPPANSLSDADPVAYCQNIRSIHPAKLMLDQAFLSAAPSPFPTEANSLFTFMAMRYVASYGLLNCQALLHEPVNVTLITNSEGVVTGATFQ